MKRIDERDIPKRRKGETQFGVILRYLSQLALHEAHEELSDDENFMRKALSIFENHPMQHMSEPKNG